jgi:hypothetical protein
MSIASEAQAEKEVECGKPAQANAPESNDINDSPTGGIICDQVECKFVAMLSLEIRNEIYKLLIVHPALGQCIVGTDGLVTRPASYGLSPAIIRTCRKIKLECETLLYGITTFSMVCAPTLFTPGRHDVVKAGMMSHLTRHMESEPILFLRMHPGVMRVQKWRVVVSPYQDTRGPLRDFKALCRAIVHSPVTSLEIVMIPAGLEATIQEKLHNAKYSCSVFDLLRPLKTLRNVGSLTIRNTDVREFPASVLESLEPLRYGHFDCASLEATYKPVVQGSIKVEHTFEIYHSLLAYAHTFENCKPFSAEMASNQEFFFLY